MGNSCKSEYLKIYNGVIQGCVMSCHLFNLYIDPLLVHMGVDCGGHCPSPIINSRGEYIISV